MRNMVKGHARAYRIIHQLQPHAMVGFAKHFRAMAPARKAFPPDRWVTNFSYNSFNNAFADALAGGKLKFAYGKLPSPKPSKPRIISVSITTP
jgi:beta-glucosidase/6-phospho-beta-glucosidase/beta-galactosidase